MSYMSFYTTTIRGKRWAACALHESRNPDDDSQFRVYLDRELARLARRQGVSVALVKSRLKLIETRREPD